MEAEEIEGCKETTDLWEGFGQMKSTRARTKSRVIICSVQEALLAVFEDSNDVDSDASDESYASEETIPHSDETSDDTISDPPVKQPFSPIHSTRIIQSTETIMFVYSAER